MLHEKKLAFNLEKVPTHLGGTQHNVKNSEIGR